MATFSHFRKTLLNFGNSTSAHGFLPFTTSGYVWRIIWGVAVITAWCVLGYQIVTACLDYTYYPSTTVVKQAYSNGIPFPIVTICNLNPIRRGIPDVEDTLQKLNLTQWTKLLEKELLNHFLEGNLKFEPIDHIFKLTLAQVLYSAWNSKFGHQLDETIVHCSTPACDGMLNVTWHHGFYGNCFSLRANQDKILSSGANFGLRMLLTAQTWLYDSQLSAVTGFRVLLHDIGTTPFPADHGFTVSTGASVEIGVFYSSSSRLPLPYDGTNCYQDQDFIANNVSMYLPLDWKLSKSLASNGEEVKPKYLQDSCVRSCYLSSIIETCGCVLALDLTKDLVERHYRNQNLIPCDFKNSTMMSCLFAVQKNTKSTSNDCGTLCPQACKESKYLRTMSVSQFPSKLYVQQVIVPKLSELAPIAATKQVDILDKIGLLLDADIKQAILDKNWNRSVLANVLEEVRNNYVDLNIYFNEFNYMLTEEFAKWTIVDLMSNIGGLLGLYSGMSFLTILEFVQCCSHLCGYKRKLNTANGDVEMSKAP